MTDRSRPLSEKRVLQILEAYGANPEKWPALERKAVELRAEESSELGAALDDAATLDELLANAPRGEVNLRLLSQVLASAPKGAPRLGLHSVCRGPNLARISGRFVLARPLSAQLAARFAALILIAAFSGIGFGFLTARDAGVLQTVVFIDQVPGGLEALESFAWESNE